MNRDQRPRAAEASAVGVGRRDRRPGSERASLFERDGVRAAIVPASPQRSMPNSIAYQTAAALGRRPRRARRGLRRLPASPRARSGCPSSTPRRSRCSRAPATSSTASPTAMSLELDELRAARRRRSRVGRGADARRARPAQRPRLRLRGRRRDGGGDDRGEPRHHPLRGETWRRASLRARHDGPRVRPRLLLRRDRARAIAARASPAA